MAPFEKHGYQSRFGDGRDRYVDYPVFHRRSPGPVPRELVMQSKQIVDNCGVSACQCAVKPDNRQACGRLATNLCEIAQP